MHENAKPFSSKCQFVSAIMLVVVIIEIYTIQEYESGVYGQNGKSQRHPYKTLLNARDSHSDPDNITTPFPHEASSVTLESKINDLPLPKHASLTSEISKPVQLYLSLKDQLEEHLKKATEKKVKLLSSLVTATIFCVTRFFRNYCNVVTLLLTIVLGYQLLTN